ncbi:Tyrosine-protein kinase [Aphelenchoides besseyi]|nr:Tyrosine-protein kinase [Aphelenchoides besseyi]
MDEEHKSLSFFHGFLPDEDANRLLQQDGDFLLQSRNTSGPKRTKLILAVRSSTIRRFEFHRTENGDFRLLVSSTSNRTNDLQGQTFPTVKAAIDHFQTFDSNTKKLRLKRPIPKTKYQLAHKDIRLIRKIGSGSYGTVYKGLLVRKPVAVKRIDSYGKTGQKLKEMMKEARVMQIYDHKNIVKFYGFVVDRPPLSSGHGVVYIEDKLRSTGRLIDVPFRVDWSAQAACGLEYLHKKLSIHRDVSARNCLLSGSILKLADFGMCRETEIYKVDLSKPLNHRKFGKRGETKFNTDVYAFGILLWELFIRPYRCPYGFWSASKVRKLTLDGYRMPTPDGMPDQMAVVMKRCWDHQPAKRPTASELRRELHSINRMIGNTPSDIITSFERSSLSTSPNTAKPKSLSEVVETAISPK